MGPGTGRARRALALRGALSAIGAASTLPRPELTSELDDKAEPTAPPERTIASGAKGVALA